MSLNDKADLDRAREKAKSFSKDYTMPPIPILEIAERNEVDVVFANFGSYANKVAGFCDFAERKLYVNSEDSFNKQIFTMAHEFGHWVLHKEKFESDPES